MTTSFTLPPEDAVFLPSEEDRAEYVLSDTGYVYMGSFRQVKEKPWNFGQVAWPQWAGVSAGRGWGKAGGVTHGGPENHPTPPHLAPTFFFIFFGFYFLSVLRHHLNT